MASYLPFAGAMSRVTVNGVDLFFEEHGEGVTIAGIHGTPSSALLGADAAPELAGMAGASSMTQRLLPQRARPTVQ